MCEYTVHNMVPLAREDDCHASKLPFPLRSSSLHTYYRSTISTAHLQDDDRGETPQQAARKGTEEVASPVLAGTIQRITELEKQTEANQQRMKEFNEKISK